MNKLEKIKLMVVLSSICIAVVAVALLLSNEVTRMDYENNQPREIQENVGTIENYKKACRDAIELEFDTIVVEDYILVTDNWKGNSVKYFCKTENAQYYSFEVKSNISFETENSSEVIIRMEVRRGFFKKFITDRE